jgi:thiamine pyrophosphate-dependent acetolactate synthase large subunit-like protein
VTDEFDDFGRQRLPRQFRVLRHYRQCSDHGDMSAMFTPVVKKSWRIRKVEDLVKALPDAFSMMRTGRPGPVHFDIPYDLYMRTAPVATPDPGAHGQPLNWRTRWPTKPSSGRSPFSPARKDRSYSREEACA